MCRSNSSNSESTKPDWQELKSHIIGHSWCCIVYGIIVLSVVFYIGYCFYNLVQKELIIPCCVVDKAKCLLQASDETNKLQNKCLHSKKKDLSQPIVYPNELSSQLYLSTDDSKNPSLKFNVSVKQYSYTCLWLIVLGVIVSMLLILSVPIMIATQQKRFMTFYLDIEELKNKVQKVEQKTK